MENDERGDWFEVAIVAAFAGIALVSISALAALALPWVIGEIARAVAPLVVRASLP